MDNPELSTALIVPKFGLMKPSTALKSGVVYVFPFGKVTVAVANEPGE